MSNSEKNRTQIVFKKHNLPRYTFKVVDYGNHNDYVSDINQVLNYIKSELGDTWENYPTYGQTLDRFEANSICYLMYWNDIVIGWTWVNKNVTDDYFVDVKQELKEKEMYWGGLFITNSMDKPLGCSSIITFKVFEDILDRFELETVYGHHWEWAVKPQNIFRKCGSIDENWKIF